MAGVHGVDDGALQHRVDLEGSGPRASRTRATMPGLLMMARWTMTALPPCGVALALHVGLDALPLRFIQLFARGVQRRRRRTCSGCLPGPGAGPSTPARTNAASGPCAQSSRARRGCTRGGSAWEWRRRAGELGVGVVTVDVSAAAASTRGRAVCSYGLRLFRRVHPGWDVALHVQHAPDVHMVAALDVEHEVGGGGSGARPQAREVELVGIAGANPWRHAGRGGRRRLKRVDKSQAKAGPASCKVPVDGGVDVRARLCAWDQGLGLHARLRRSALAAGPGADALAQVSEVAGVGGRRGRGLAPLQQAPRSRRRSWSRRISSRTYSLLVP